MFSITGLNILITMVKKTSNNNFQLISFYQIHHKINLFYPDKLYAIVMKKLSFSIVLQALILPFNFLQNIAAGVTVAKAILASIVKF